MFESYIRSLYEHMLGPYLEDYFENVSDQNITFKLWSGRVALTDLKIRKTMFQSLNMPFILKLGIIKTLEINMPYMNIQSAPVVANVDEVYLVVAPQNPDEWEMLDKVCFDFKIKKFEEYIKRFVEHALIKQAEKSVLESQDAKDKKQQDDKKGEGQSFFSSFLKRIQDNVKIEIKNVHIRLEDQKEVDVHGQGPGVKAYEQMCIGLSLREIVLQTIEYKPDEKEESIVNGDDDESDKLSNAGEAMAFQEGSQVSESPLVLSMNQSKQSADDTASKRKTKDNQGSKLDKGSVLKLPTEAPPLLDQPSYYFDRTLPKNKDQPLQRELSVKDLAIYIESAKFQNNQPEKADQVVNMISFRKPEFFKVAAQAPTNIRGRNRIETIKEVPENVEGSAKQTREDEDAESMSSVSSSDAESSQNQAHASDAKSRRSRTRQEKKEKKKKKAKKVEPEDGEGLDEVMRDLNEQMYFWFDQDEHKEPNKADGLSYKADKQGEAKDRIGEARSDGQARPTPKFKKPSFLMEPQSIQIKIIQQTIDLGDEKQQRVAFELELQKKREELEKHLQAEQENKDKIAEETESPSNPLQSSLPSSQFMKIDGDASLEAKLKAELNKKFVMKPQISWIINMLTPLQVRLSSAQFKCIYSLVSFIRQFQLAKSGYNLPQKYKYLRPVFAKPTLTNKEIQATWWADFKELKNKQVELEQEAGSDESKKSEAQGARQDELEMEFGDEEQDQIEEAQNDDLNDNIDDFVLVEQKIEILDEITQKEEPQLPEIGLEDIQFTTIVDNLRKKNRGEVVSPIYSAPPPHYHVERSLFRENNAYRTEAMFRHELQRVPTQSMAAKSLFQFAVLCVIKNNRMKRGEMMKDDGRNLQHQDQFQMNNEQRNAHFNALKHLLEKALSYSGHTEDTKDKKVELLPDGQRKVVESTSKKEKELVKNLQQMMADQRSQKVNKENAFEKPMWIRRARVAFTDMEELVLRHSLEALTISDLKRWTRLVIHEFVIQIEQAEKAQIEEQRLRELQLQHLKDDLKQQFSQIKFDAPGGINPSKEFLTPRQSSMMVDEESDQLEVKSSNANPRTGYRWMSFFKSTEPKSPQSASCKTPSRGSSKNAEQRSDNRNALEVEFERDLVMGEPLMAEQNEATINETQPQEEQERRRTGPQKKEVEINILESTPTLVDSPSDQRGQSSSHKDESIDDEGQARAVSDTHQIKEKTQLSNSSVRMSFVEIDSDEALEAKIEAGRDGLPNKFRQPLNEFFEEAKDKKDQMFRDAKETKEEILKEAKEKKQQFMDTLETQAADVQSQFKKIVDKDMKKDEKEKKAQAVPIIENLNNFTYLVSINLSMIKVQLVDINRQKNAQATSQQNRKEANNPQVSSSLCLEVYGLGAFYHQFWERNIFTIQNKSLVVHEQQNEQQETKAANDDKEASGEQGSKDENNFIQIRGSKELKMRQAWKLTLKALETTGPSVDNFVENSTFFVDDSVQTEETASPHLNIDSTQNQSEPAPMPLQQSQKEIEFQLGKVSVLYKSQVIRQLYQFFRLDEKASKVNMALNKLAEKTEQQEKQRYIEEQKEKIKNKIKVHYYYNIEQIEVKLPFKLQHAKQSMTPESARDRQWLFNIQNIEVRPPLFEDELESEHSVCDLFRLFIKEVSLTYFKGNNQKLAYPIIAPSGFDLLLKVKNSLKYLLAQQDANHLNAKKENSSTTNLKSGKRSTLEVPAQRDVPQELVEIPDIDICLQKNRSLRKLVLNFTPDSYNGLLNIYSVLQPNVDKSTAFAQFQEKMTILEQCIFKKNLLCKLPIPQLENRPSSESWQKFDVVLSGDYLYFYKDKFTLLPSYFMEVASIQSQSQENKIPRQSFQMSPAEDHLYFLSRPDPKTASARNLYSGRSSCMFQKSTELRFYSCESSKMANTIDNSPIVDIRNKKNGQVARIDFSSKGQQHSPADQATILKNASEDSNTVPLGQRSASPQAMPKPERASEEASEPTMVNQNVDEAAPKLIKIQNVEAQQEPKGPQQSEIDQKRPSGQVSSTKINFLSNNQQLKQATLIVGGSDKSDEEYDREGEASSSSSFGQSEDLSQNTNIKIEQFDSFSRARSHIEVQLNEELKLKKMFLGKISDRQNEINMAHLQKEASTLQKEHHYISSQVTQWEDYHKQVSFQLSLQANELELRMHENEDFVDVDEVNQEHDPQDCWTSIRSCKFDLFLKQAIYNMRCDVALKDTSIVEHKIFKREMIYLPQTTLIENYVWARDSPTVDDSYMNTIVSLSKNSSKNEAPPVVLYEPQFINRLTRFFKNTANQELTSLNFYIQKLFDQKKQEIKLKKEKQRFDRAPNFRKITKMSERGSSDDDFKMAGIRSVDSALSSPSNSINQKYMTPQFKTSFGPGGGGGTGAHTHKSNDSDKNKNINQFKVDVGSRELKTIQVGDRGAFDKEIMDRGWSSSGSDLNDDTPDLESRSNDSLKKRQKLSEERMNKTIAKHQNCKKVYQLWMMTKIIGLRGLQLVCLHHSVQMAPFFEIKAETFELTYDAHLDHSILDVQLGVGQDGFSDLTSWPWTRNYKENAVELSKDSFRCKDFINKLHRQCIIQRMNPSKRSVFRIKTTMYTENCPRYLEDSKKNKQLVATEFFLNNVFFKYYQELFFRLLSYFINRFLWAVTDADPYEQYEKEQQKKNAVKPKPLPDTLQEIKDLEQSDFSLDFSMDITESAVVLQLRPQADKEPYFQVDVDKIRITSETEQKLGRLRQCPNVPMKMTKFVIDCLSSSLVVMPMKRVISNKFDLQLTYASPIESELIKQLPFQRMNADQRPETVLDMSSELGITIQQNDFKNHEEPEVEITLTREIFCLIMKLNSLNMACSDGSDLFDFAWEKGIFEGEKRRINYMQILLMVKGSLAVLLEDDEGKAFAKLSVSQVDTEQSVSARRSNNNLKPKRQQEIDQSNHADQSADAWFMKCKMYTNNQMQLNLNMMPKLTRVQRRDGVEHRYLILGEFNDTYDQSKEARQRTKFKLKEHCRLGVCCKFYETGVIVVQCRLRNSMIYADINTLMRVAHVFVQGLPTYDKTDEFKPLEMETDRENSPGLKFEFKVSGSCLGLLDLDADPKRFGPQHPVLICNPHQIFFSYDSNCIKDIKNALYKAVKKYRIDYRKKLRNEKANHIKSMQIAPFSINSQFEGASTGYKQRQHAWKKDNLPLASIDESSEMGLNRNDQVHDSLGEKQQTSAEKKFLGGSLPRLSEQDSQYESEDSRALNEEQEEVMDVACDVVSQMTVKLSRIGIQIIPLEKLEMLEFAMSRDLISPLNTEIVIQECLKVQFRDLERPSTFALFDRMDVDVEPLSIHATVKDLEVLQQIMGSVAGSWNRYSEFNNRFTKHQMQARKEKLQQMQQNRSHAYLQQKEQPFGEELVQDGIFISEQQAGIENFLVPGMSREDRELSREHSQQFMSCISHKVSGNESHFDQLPESKQKQTQDYESIPFENYESGKAVELSMLKRRQSNLRHEIDNMDSYKNSQKTLSRHAESHRRNVHQSLRFNEKAYLLPPTGKDLPSMQSSQDNGSLARDVKKAGIHQISQKLYFNNVSQHSEHSRHSLKSRRSRRSMLSRQSISEEMNQFHDAQSRLLEKQSNFDSGEDSSPSDSESSSTDDEEMNEESFLSCRVPFSVNNSVSMEQPRRIVAVRAQDYPPDKSPQKPRMANELTVVRETTVDGNSSYDPSGQKKQESQAYLLTDLSIEGEQKTLATELKEAEAVREQDGGFHENFDGMLNRAGNDEAQPMILNAEDTQYEKQEEISESSSSDDFINQTIIQWKTINAPAGAEDQRSEGAKRQNVTQVQLKSLNLVLLLPPYIKKSSIGAIGSDAHLSKKIENEILQYFPMIMLNVENVLFKVSDFDNDNKMQLASESQARASLNIDYYNGRLDCWEPFLEHFQIEMLKHTLEDGSSEQMIEAKKSINLNITEELIENVSCLQNLSRDSPLFITDKQAPTVFSAMPTTQFKISNLTSKAILIRPNVKNTNKLREQVLKYQSRLQNAQSMTDSPQVQYIEGEPAMHRPSEGHSPEHQRSQQFHQRQQLLLQEKVNKKRQKMQNKLAKHPFVLQHQKHGRADLNQVTSPQRSLVEQRSRRQSQADQAANMALATGDEPAFGGAQLLGAPAPQEGSQQQLLKINSGQSGIYHVRRAFQDNQGLLSKRQQDSSTFNNQMSDKIDIIVHKHKRELPKHEAVDTLVIKEETTTISRYNLFRKTVHYQPMTGRTNDFIIFGLSEGLLSLQKDMNSYQRSLMRSIDFRLRNVKTLTIRNPFVLINKTEYVYLVKIQIQGRMQNDLAYPSETWQLSPGQSYPISYSEYKHAKFYLAMNLDHPDNRLERMSSNYSIKSVQHRQATQKIKAKEMALKRIDQPDKSIQWSHGFTIRQFFEVKEDPKNKSKAPAKPAQKCLVQHQKRFSMIFAEPSSFFTGSDICIKSPVIIKNMLPLDILIRTRKVLDYQYKAYEIHLPVNEEVNENELMAADDQIKDAQKGKEIIYSQEMETKVIEPGRSFSFHNFHLNKEIGFELNVRINRDHQAINGQFQGSYDHIEEDTLVLDWHHFELNKKQFKDPKPHIFSLKDRENGQPLQLKIRVGRSLDTDVEMRVECDCIFKNLTEFPLRMFRQESRNQAYKVIGGQDKNPANSQWLSIFDQSKDCRIGLLDETKDAPKHLLPPFQQSKQQVSTVMLKVEDEKYFELIMTQKATLLSIKQMKIRYSHIIENRTGRSIIVSHLGWETRQGEILADGHNLPLYWPQSNPDRKLCFKFIENDMQEQDSPVDDIQHQLQQDIPQIQAQSFVFTGGVPVQQISSTPQTILCPNIESPQKSATLEIFSRQVQKSYFKHTNFIVLRCQEIEDPNGDGLEQHPQYLIQNRSQSVDLEYEQRTNRSDIKWTVRAGTNQILSFVDFKTGPSAARKLYCYLVSRRNQVQIDKSAKIPVEFEALTSQQGVPTWSKEVRLGTPGTKEGSRHSRSDVIVQKTLRMEVLQDKVTKILRITEIEKAVPAKHQTASANDQLQSEEAQVDLDGPQSTLKIRIPQIFVSVISHCLPKNMPRQEFILVCLNQLIYEQTTSNQVLSHQFRISSIQIDNNLCEEAGQQAHPFPILLYSVHALEQEWFNLVVEIQRDAEKEDRPAEKKVIIVKRFEYLVQKMVLQIDDEVIWCIQNMVQQILRSLPPVEKNQFKSIHKPDDEGDTVAFEALRLNEQKLERYWELYDRSMNLPVLKKHAFKLSEGEHRRLVYPSQENFDDRMKQQILIQFVSISPIQLTLTFTPRLTSSQKESQQQQDHEPVLSNRNPWLVLIRNLGLSLTAVEQAPLNLNALQQTDLVINTRGELTLLIQNHYLRKAYMTNAFKAILSWNTLGNINMLVSDVGTGVKDFFYEPYQGYIQGPAQGTKGLIKGSVSLVGHTAKGTIGTVGRIFGSVSHGMLVLADDREYLNQRQGSSVRDGAPENVYQGLKVGLRSAYTGVKSGLRGIYQEPIRGARQHGVVKGLLKGSARGLGGAIIKPTSGVLDLIAKTSQGTENMIGRKKALQLPPSEEVSSLSSDPHLLEQSRYQASSTRKLRELRPLFSSCGQLRQFSSLDNQAFAALVEYLGAGSDAKPKKQAEPDGQGNHPGLFTAEQSREEETYEGVCLLNDNLAFVMSTRRLLGFEFKDNSFLQDPKHEALLSEIFTIDIAESKGEFPLLVVKTIHRREKSGEARNQPPVRESIASYSGKQEIVPRNREALQSKAEHEAQGPRSPRTAFLDEMQNIQINEKISIRIQDRVEGQMVCRVLQDWQQVMMHSR